MYYIFSSLLGYIHAKSESGRRALHGLMLSGCWSVVCHSDFASL